MEKGARYWIEKLQLCPHPEGGWFSAAYRSAEQIRKECLPDRFPGARAVVSSIYYLLTRDDFSAFHRIRSVEIWNYYAGVSLTLYVLEPDGGLSELQLGGNADNGEIFQAAVEPGRWFAAAVNDPGEFCLVGCTVTPGFDYEDFELARRKDLIAEYPQHKAVIERLTRG